MPNPAITLKLKRFRQRFRQRFGITAPRVTVRTHYGWHWYIAGGFALLLLVVLGAWWLAQHDEAVQMRSELAGLRQSLGDAQAELDKLRSTAGTEQSVVRIERSTQQQLAARLKAMEQENSALKEDVALFEKLVPATGAESVLRVERLSVISSAEPGRYRYRLLVAFQPSKEEREFRGRLQLIVTAVQAGKEIHLQLPQAKDPPADYLVEMRHFLRKEGNIALPVGAKIKSVEARILQGGNLKAKQLFNY
ncbi:MAG: hypothetical protein H6R18_2196 [Proteobacteria bacterium]|nr:hypothetical protein [Pseudomonadota bacterium]